jgi:integrase
MDETKPVVLTSQQMQDEYRPALDSIIEEWLDSVFTSRSRSNRTITEYRKRMESFRQVLQDEGLDLDSPEQERIANLAKQWASSRSELSRYKDQPIAQSTFDLRLATISSFYIFIQEKQKQDGHPEYPNPITRIKRPRIQAYASAEPLDAEFVAEALANIDRSTREGKRSYAILVLGLRTGRRARELINLRAKHIVFMKSKMRVSFERVKGGKKMKDTLDEDVAAVMLDYLNSVYPGLKGFTGDAPVWVSFSRRNYMQPMTIHTLYDICEDVLQTTKIHALRHTFAYESEQEGATASDLQHRLGHASIAQVGTYLKAMRSDENPIGEKLTKKFKITRYQSK